MDHPSRSARFSFSLLWQGWFTFLIALYRRPVAFLCLLFTVPLAVVSCWIFIVNEGQWRARESRNLLTTARLAARTIQEEFERTQRIEAALMAHPEEREALLRRDRPALTATLKWLMDMSPNINRARILDAHGRVVVEVRPGPLEGSTHAALEDVVPSWPAADSVSGVYLSDEPSMEKVVAVTSAIEHVGAPIGMVQVQYRLEEIARWLEKIRIEPAGFLYVADRQGLLMAYPFQLLPGAPKDVSAWTPVAVPPSVQGRILQFAQGSPPQPWTAAVVTLEPSGWRVVAQQADRHMLGPFRTLVWSFVVLVVLVAMFVSLCAGRWARLHRATLRLLAQQARLLQLSEQRRVQLSLRGRRRGIRGTDDGR